MYVKLPDDVQRWLGDSGPFEYSSSGSTPLIWFDKHVLSVAEGLTTSEGISYARQTSVAASYCGCRACPELVEGRERARTGFRIANYPATCSLCVPGLPTLVRGLGPCLCSFRFLCDATPLTAGDQAYGFICTHAAHLSGGVHGTQDHATASQKELRRLDVLAVSGMIAPPRIDGVCIRLGATIGYGKGQPSTDDFLCLLQSVDTDGVDGATKLF